MNKKKRIRELEEWVAILERRIEVLERIAVAWDRYARQPFDPWQPYSPVYTADGAIVKMIK